GSTFGNSPIRVTVEEVLFVMWGLGANGKSTFRETKFALLGDYAIPLPRTRENAANGLLARFRRPSKGARLGSTEGCDPRSEVFSLIFLRSPTHYSQNSSCEAAKTGAFRPKLEVLRPYLTKHPTP